MESKHAGKAEEPGDSYVPPEWIVCYACTVCQDELTVISVCIVSIIRVPYIASISSPASLADPSWSLAYAAIWTIVELNIAIVSACLPTLRPLFVRVFHGRYTPAIAEGTFQERRTGHEGKMSSSTISPECERVDSATWKPPLTHNHWYTLRARQVVGAFCGNTHTFPAKGCIRATTWIKARR